LKFLIIIPAHNEQENIRFTLQSLQNQTFQDFSCVIVNDGSTDKTRQIVEEFTENDEKFKLKNLELSEHQPGAKVVRTFNKGLEIIDLEGYEVICKFDADIIFPEDYLQRIAQLYLQQPHVGMASGLVRISPKPLQVDKAFDFKDEEQNWIFENLSSKNHVRGPIKSYRRTCFRDMGGLRTVLGWDNIDVMLAQKHGWEVRTIKDLWVKHLRPTAFKYKKQKAEKLGEYFYNIGLNFPLAALSSAKSAWKNKSPAEFFGTMKSFLKQKAERSLTRAEVRYIRNLRWRQMFKIK